MSNGPGEHLAPPSDGFQGGCFPPGLLTRLICFGTEVIPLGLQRAQLLTSAVEPPGQRRQSFPFLL